jgi:hypothetical protein
MIFALITMYLAIREKRIRKSYQVIHSVIQKFNPDDGYPFILTET